MWAEEHKKSPSPGLDKPLFSDDSGIGVEVYQEAIIDLYENLWESLSLSAHFSIMDDCKRKEREMY